jgi:hypothetical protein
MSFSYRNSTFAELITQYPSWVDLKAFLESEEGGSFRIVDQDESDLCIIRYEKGVSNMNLPHSRWFRSVVWNMETNRPLCIAPPKAMFTDLPVQTTQQAKEEGMVCQELLDGFMINCFTLAGDKTLHICSRYKLNASGKFYSSKSFRELFIEAHTGRIKNEDESLESYIQEESQKWDQPDPEKKEIAYGYSFLVQHKEHRIVKIISENRVILIHKTIVYEDGTVQFEENLRSIPIGGADEKITYVHTWIQTTLEEQTWEFQGIALKDKEGNRWRFRSNAYSMVKNLRGNAAYLLERFVPLYQRNIIPYYISYYPEDKDTMEFYTVFLNHMVQYLHGLYMDVHVQRTTPIQQIDRMYHPHLYALHGIYLSRKKPMTVIEVYDYIRLQPWQRIAFLLRNNQDAYTKQLLDLVDASSA